MKTFKNLIICLLLSLISHIGYGQKYTLELDLSSISPGKIKILSENKNLTYKAVRLINTVPAKDYSVKFELERIMLDHIDVSDVSNDNLLPDNEFEELCLEFETYLAHLKINKNLKEIDIKNITKPELMQKIKYCIDTIASKRTEINKERTSPEKDKKLTQLSIYENHINKLIEETKTMFQKQDSLDIQVGTGEIGRVYVSSGDSIWTFVLKGIEKGQWITTYGFSFTSKKSETLYYSKQSNDTNTFQIMKARQADFWDLNYIPGIFFSYFPTRNLNSFWNHSLTAGLGLNLSEPIIFFGYNGLFFQNIGISSGIAFQERYRLKDQFNENDIISLNLDKNQLHDKIYRPSLFLSINFRFSENPFKIKSSSENTNNDNN